MPKAKTKTPTLTKPTDLSHLRFYDNSRVSDARRCLRYFMFRHVFHWQSDSLSMPLIFGGCWHKAMEVVWPGLIAGTPKAELCEAALKVWLLEWAARGMPPPEEIDYEQEKEWSPRTPMVAMEMLVAYVSERAKVKQDFELLAVEQPFAVPIDPDDPTLFYIGKIDKIVRDKGGKRKIRGIEHKTTTAYKKADKLPFRSTFLDSFSPNSQVDGYLYALHMTYPGQVGGVWVDAALVHKEKEGFTYIPVERQHQHLDMWLWELRYWINLIEQNKAALDASGTQDRYLAAFPKNTNSCFDFSTSCQYLKLCKAWTNPLGKPVPPGFHVEKWDPLHELDLSRLEIPK